jgi:UDP-N-acetyl-D-glucosamine 4,6-dehydratase
VASLFNKKTLNFLVIIILTFVSFAWTFFIFHTSFDLNLVLIIVALRFISSSLLFRDYSLSWSRATQKTFLIKAVVYITPFLLYAPYFHGEFRFAFLISELFLYLFLINFLMFAYYYFVNKSSVKKTKSVVIFGGGSAGVKIAGEFKNSYYKVEYFCDDDKQLSGRSIDSVKILTRNSLQKKLLKNKYDLLIIAIPSSTQSQIKNIYDEFNGEFNEIKILPSLENILSGKDFTTQLKEISVEDLLARRPKDLDKKIISEFVKNKTILITGAGGSIGSEIARQCVLFNAKQLILLDNSEFNLYKIEQELGENNIVPVMQNVVDVENIEKTFNKYNPDIVIHAAAYKHVPLVEANIDEAIVNNIIGTKNVIDSAIKNNVKKVVLISTDKAVRPTNVMGATKRICELYAQNVESKNTKIAAVRFGNVLGSSGSVIPKFKQQIASGENITVTHPDITRYFMLIPEACELVLQAGAIGGIDDGENNKNNGEIFILDMGEPIKIVDLANKMIELSGNSKIQIEFSGLRPGEKLYEELLIDDSDTNTKYESITIAKKTEYNFERLVKDINRLIKNTNKIAELQKIVPEFNHKLN